MYRLYNNQRGPIMPAMGDGVYLDLDGAWEPSFLGTATVEARSWGPRLRYHAKRADVEAFFHEIVRTLPRCVLYGSGDFHHVSGSLLRRWATDAKEPITLVSFDNHPDWDIRPPRWACGGWVNRALEIPSVKTASIWGCGNFELAFPSSLFRNRKALKSGRMTVQAWAERQSAKTAARFDCMTRGNWRERFSRFVEALAGQAIYITVDLDCLRDEEIVTNWENGLFTADDVAWAIGLLRQSTQLIAGDMCGSRSTEVYSRWFQRLAGRWDHPRLPDVPLEVVRRRNTSAVETIWRALTD